MTRRRHAFDKPDVDLNQLRAELAARLGRPVDLRTSEPTPDEPDGVLVVTDADDEVLDLDEALVADVLAKHVPKVEPSVEERALRQFDAAETDAQRLQAFRDYLVVRVAEQDKARERSRRARQERRRASRQGRAGGSLGGRQGPNPGPLAEALSEPLKGQGP